MIERAQGGASCSALVLTLDLQVIGQRHKDLKNGLTAPPRPTLRNIVNLATKPRWCLGMLGTRRAHLPQPGRPRQGRQRHELAGGLDQRAVRPAPVVGRRRVGQEALGRQADPQGHPGRGRRAAGRRQRRRRASSSATTAAASSTARRAASRRCRRSWPRSAARSRCTWTAASAAARTCSRPGRWAPAARTSAAPWSTAWARMGEAGVTKALQIIHKELDITMAFCGHTKIGTVDRGILLPGTFPTA